MQIKLLLLASAYGVYAGCQSHWEGTAPFCNSDCPSGEVATGIFDSNGNGAHCFTGQKQICKKCGPIIVDSPPCSPRLPVCHCEFLDPIPVGIQICDNGCGTYADGPCLKIGFFAHEQPASTLPSNFSKFGGGMQFDIAKSG